LLCVTAWRAAAGSARRAGRAAAEAALQPPSPGCGLCGWRAEGCARCRGAAAAWEPAAGLSPAPFPGYGLARGASLGRADSDDAFRIGLARVGGLVGPPPRWLEEASGPPSPPGWPFGPDALALPLPGGAPLTAAGVPFLPLYGAVVAPPGPPAAAESGSRAAVAAEEAAAEEVAGA